MQTTYARRANGREERGRALARAIAQRIAAVAPPGLGQWPEAWAITSSPNDAVLGAIHEWEAAGVGSPREVDLRAAVNEAAARAVDAWREAARRWEQAGRPGAREAEVPTHAT